MKDESRRHGLAMALTLILSVTVLSGCTFLTEYRVKEYLKKIRPILKTAAKIPEDTDYLEPTSIVIGEDEDIDKVKEEWGAIKQDLKNIKEAERKLSDVQPFGGAQNLHNQLKLLLKDSKKTYEKANVDYKYLVSFAEIINKYGDQIEDIRAEAVESGPVVVKEKHASANKEIISLYGEEKQELEKLKPPVSFKKMHQGYLSAVDLNKKFFQKVDELPGAGDKNRADALFFESGKVAVAAGEKSEEARKEILNQAGNFNNQLHKLRENKTKVDGEVTKLETRYNLR